jgi:hypothetical protein
MDLNSLASAKCFKNLMPRRRRGEGRLVQIVLQTLFAASGLNLSARPEWDHDLCNIGNDITPHIGGL